MSAPEVFNKLDGSHIRDAEDTIARIKSTFTAKLDLIVDVGCGRGNITHLLSAAFPHAKIVAFDIDPNMIEFAQRNYKNDLIQYCVQDISADFDNFCPLLKELEDKVSLIWSNHVLHWVENKCIAAQNIARLLRSHGRCFANILFVPDINDHLPENERVNNELFLKVPSLQTQMQDWGGYFLDVMMKEVEIVFMQRHWDYENPAVVNRIYTNYISVYEQYTNKCWLEYERSIVAKSFEDVIIRKFQTKLGDPLLKEINRCQSVLHYGQLLVTFMK